MSRPSTMRMPDTLLLLLVVGAIALAAAIIQVAGLLLAGRPLTAASRSAVSTAVARARVVGALVALRATPVPELGGRTS